MMINFLMVKDVLLAEGALMKIEVLGTDGVTCKTLFQAALEALRLSGKKGRVVFVNDIKKILRYGVLAPAIAINGAVVFSGSRVSPEEILALLNQNITPFT
jgi:hypothetical protein